MAIIVLFTLGTLPAIFSPEKHTKKVLSLHTESQLCTASGALARSSTTKATFIVRLCAFSTQLYKILASMARERQAHSLHCCSLTHNTQRNAFNEWQTTCGDSGSPEVRNSFAELQIEIACKFVQDILLALSKQTERATLYYAGFCTGALDGDACIIASEESSFDASTQSYIFMAALINYSGHQAASQIPFCLNCWQTCKLNCVINGLSY